MFDFLKSWILLAIIFLVLANHNASALESDPIFITLSGSMNQIVFDGKWSFVNEWKESTLTTLNYDDGTQIQLRTSHQDNFIYVLVDFVTDTQMNKGSDSATICFEKESKENSTNDPYCFVSILDGRSFVLEKNSIEKYNFMVTHDIPEFIANSTSSDQNDRYSPTPHATYEFRIPTDLVGRSDMYKFYMGAFDTHHNKMYTWPQDISINSSLTIPDAIQWGEIISPDKSLPEFPLPVLLLLTGSVFAIYLTRKTRK